eukprot:g22617.t1
MVGDQKVLLFIAYRVQMLYEMVSESTLGLTHVEEVTSGAVDAVDQVDGCAGGHLGCLGVECPILRADRAEAEELGIGDHILAG